MGRINCFLFIYCFIQVELLLNGGYFRRKNELIALSKVKAKTEKLRSIVLLKRIQKRKTVLFHALMVSMDGYGILSDSMIHVSLKLEQDDREKNFAIIQGQA